MASLADRQETANVVVNNRPGSGKKFDGECSYCGEYGHMRRKCRKRISDERRAASGGGGGNGCRGGGRRNFGRGNFANRNKQNPYNRNPDPKSLFKKKGKRDGTNKNAN